MNFFKNIFSFYINSSIHVALAVCAFIGITAIEFDIEVSKALWGFVFFGTITGYNFVKYVEVALLKHRSLSLTLRTIQIFSFFCFLVLIFFTLKLPFRTLLVTGGFAVLTFFYAIPFLKSKSLRALIGIKIIIVAIVWAGVTLIIPLINENELINTSVWISFLQRVLFVLVLTLPFEIRDLQYDKLALGTIPQQVGVTSTKIIGLVLLLVALLIGNLKSEIDWGFNLSFGLIIILLLTFLMFSQRKQSNYFASFWVESIPMIWFAIFYFIKIF